MIPARKLENLDGFFFLSPWGPGSSILISSLGGEAEALSCTSWFSWDAILALPCRTFWHKGLSFFDVLNFRTIAFVLVMTSLQIAQPLLVEYEARNNFSILKIVPYVIHDFNWYDKFLERFIKTKIIIFKMRNTYTDSKIVLELSDVFWCVIFLQG